MKAVVDVGAIERAAGEMARAGTDCAGDAAGVAAALGQIEAGAMDGSVAAAGAAAQLRWGKTLGECAAGMEAVAGALRAAASAYEAVESGNTASFGGAQ